MIVRIELSAAQNIFSELVMQDCGASVKNVPSPHFVEFFEAVLDCFLSVANTGKVLINIESPVNFPSSEAKGHRFDSCRAHHIQKRLIS